jgi:hypothetical protein
VKLIPFSLLLLLPLAPAVAGGAQPPIVGSWDCVGTDAQGMRTFWILDVSPDGDKFLATLRAKEGAVELKLLEPTFEPPWFRFHLRINETEIVQVALRLDGNRLNGHFSGKDSGSGTLQGTRIEAVTVSGSWSGEWEISPDGGPGPHYMVLKQEETSVSGTAGPSADQQIPIRNGKFADGKLTFEIAIPSGPSLRFDFTVDRDSMRGDAVLAMNGVERKLKLSAKRVAP